MVHLTIFFPPLWKIVIFFKQKTRADWKYVKKKKISDTFSIRSKNLKWRRKNTARSHYDRWMVKKNVFCFVFNGLRNIEFRPQTYFLDLSLQFLPAPLHPFAISSSNEPYPKGKTLTIRWLFQPGAYGVWTDVSFFMDWINTNINNNGGATYCPV